MLTIWGSRTRLCDGVTRREFLRRGAERPRNGRAYLPRNVLATLYHVLGINPRTTTLPDASGRPQYLVDDADVVSELV